MERVNKCCTHPISLGGLSYPWMKMASTMGYLFHPMDEYVRHFIVARLIAAKAQTPLGKKFHGSDGEL